MGRWSYNLISGCAEVCLLFALHALLPVACDIVRTAVVVTGFPLQQICIIGLMRRWHELTDVHQVLLERYNA